ncbi:MAG: hypothetical protein PSX81_05855 [bacterium]|nr:hypothetical protein [bacterium]
MQYFLQSTHSIIRWLVLLGAILAIALPYLANNEYANRLNRLPALFYVITCDIQLVIGVPLYFVYSSYGASAFHNGVNNVIHNESLRSIAIEHFAITVIAYIFVHIGYFKIRKAEKVANIRKIGLLYFSISIILMLSAIPWSRIMV